MYKKDYLDLKQIKSNKIPWYWTNKLDSRNIYDSTTQTWWGPIIWSFTLTWTGNVSITWLWFKPKLVTFAVADNSSWVWSGAMTETNQYAINNTFWTYITTQCIYYWWPVKARAEYVSMDNDGFTINCIYHTTTTYVNYIAYP